VLERFDSQSTQRTMHSFLKFEQRFAKFQSKRLASAVKGIAGGSLPEVRSGSVWGPRVGLGLG